jgi:hypothetical protein
MIDHLQIIYVHAIQIVLVDIKINIIINFINICLQFLNIFLIKNINRLWTIYIGLYIFLIRNISEIIKII